MDGEGSGANVDGGKRDQDQDEPISGKDTNGL